MRLFWKRPSVSDAISVLSTRCPSSAGTRRFARKCPCRDRMPNRSAPRTADRQSSADQSVDAPGADWSVELTFAAPSLSPRRAEVYWARAEVEAEPPDKAV